MTEDVSRCRLYLITPQSFTDTELAKEALTEALSGGDVACEQLRLKDGDDAAIISVAEALIPICHAKDVAFLINDRPDLALEVGADGVHIGQDDMPVAEARKLLGPDASIGVTCHDSMHLAYQAGEGGADYVAFGAFYPSNTKEVRYHPSLNLLNVWDEVTEVPCVAIGGITASTAGELARAGAHFVAVCAGVWDYPSGPKAAVAAINAALEAAAQSLD